MPDTVETQLWVPQPEDYVHAWMASALSEHAAHVQAAEAQKGTVAKDQERKQAAEDPERKATEAREREATEAREREVARERAEDARLLYQIKSRENGPQMVEKAATRQDWNPCSRNPSVRNMSSFMLMNMFLCILLCTVLF